ARRDDSRADGTGQYSGGTESAARIFLLPAWRDHGEVDAGGGGPQFRDEPDSETARGGPESAHGGEQSGEQARREPRGACAGAGDVAFLRASSGRARAENGGDGGSNRRSAYWAGDALPFARDGYCAGAWSGKRLRARIWMQLLRHAFVSHAVYAAAGRE